MLSYIQTTLQTLSGIITAIITLFGFFCGFFGIKRVRQTNSFLVDMMTKKLKAPMTENVSYTRIDRYYQIIEEKICIANSVKPIYLLLPSQVLNKAYINCLIEGMDFQELNRKFAFWSWNIKQLEENRHKAINQAVLLFVSSFFFVLEFVGLDFGLCTSIIGSFGLFLVGYFIFFIVIPKIISIFNEIF